MSDNEESGEFEVESVDQEARDQIDRLRRRLEGAHLVPSAWVLAKQALQAIVKWPGWEVFGLGSFVLMGLALLCLIIFSTFSGCQHLDLELEQRRAAQQREQYAPSCEALGLTYTNVVMARDANDRRRERYVVCTGEDRVVTLDTLDLDETEVRMIGQDNE